MRIAHIIGTLGGYGVQRLILGLAGSRALGSSRHFVVCTYAASGELARAFQEAGVPVYACPFRWPEHPPQRPYRFWRWFRECMVHTFAWRLARLLRQIPADLVHTHVTAWIDLQAKAALEYARLPWVWTLHGVYSPEGQELARWRRAAALAASRRSCVTAVSRAIGDHWRELGLGDLAAPQVVPGGIRLGLNSAARRRRAPWRQALRIPDDAVLFGTAGRMHPVKGHEVFVEACALLADREPRAYFVLAGDGPLHERLVAKVGALRLSRRILFLGYQADIEDFLGGLDVFVLPSRSEGLPLALVEAMAAGLPCVATRVGGVPEVLEDGCGLLVPPESPSDLANAMEAMLDEGRRRSMGARAAVAAQRFSIERCAERFAEIYRGLIEGRTAGT
jgi:glycosyltransferase involved in cell wall biosynthesis